MLSFSETQLVHKIRSCCPAFTLINVLHGKGFSHIIGYGSHDSGWCNLLLLVMIVLVVVVVMMTTTMMTINGLANSLVGFKTQ
jgi:hypothetical protein